MRLDLMHLSMMPREQLDLFQEIRSRITAPSRETWLRQTFSEPVQFTHTQKPFWFVPEKDDKSTIIAGRIGRSHLSIENEPPDAGLQRVRREVWRAAAVIIDPRHHDDGQRVAMEHHPHDGQRVAMEHHPQVGTPAAVFSSLCASLNSRLPPEPYLIESEPISDPNSFWEFVEEHQSQITTLTFVFIAPNMFGIKDDLDAGLKYLKDHKKAQKVKLQLANPTVSKSARIGLGQR